MSEEEEEEFADQSDEGRRAGFRAPPLRDFEGIAVDPAIAERMDDAYRQAVALTEMLLDRDRAGRLRELAVPAPEPDTRMAMRSLSAMVAGMGGRCRIDPPPQPVSAVTDAAGNLIYRCGHVSRHEWDMSGRRLR
jgi:hypothetical protein